MKTIVRMGIEQKRQDSSRDIKCVLEEMCVYELLFYLSRWKSWVDTFFFFWTFFSSKKRLGIIVFLYLSLYSPPAPPTYKILIIIGILKTKAETARRLSQENTIEEKQGLTKKNFWPIWASEMCHTAKFLRIVNECIIYFSSISISSIVRFINHYDYFFCSPQAKQLQMLLFWQAKADCELNDIIRYVHVPYVPTCTN